MDADALRRLAGQTGFDVGTLEKDYALSWLLYGIYADPSPLATVLVLKGGTAIRKVYVPEWRLSEDLDFTAVGSVKPTTIRKGFAKIVALLGKKCSLGFKLSQFHGKPYYVQARVQFLGPLGHRNTIKLDLSLAEKLVERPVTVSVDPEYDGIPSFQVLVYTPHEILIEKLRSIMQRGYARDYYDVWRLLKNENSVGENLRKLLVKKCELSEVSYEPELVFRKDRLAEAKRHWDVALARLTPDLPTFRVVIGELRSQLEFLAE